MNVDVRVKRATEVWMRSRISDRSMSDSQSAFEIPDFGTGREGRETRTEP